MNDESSRSQDTASAAQEWLKSLRANENEGENKLAANLSNALIASETAVKKQAREMWGNNPEGIKYRTAADLTIAAESTPDSSKYAGLMVFFNRSFGPQRTGTGDLKPIPVEDCLTNNNLGVHATLFNKNQANSSNLLSEDEITRLQEVLPDVADKTGSYGFEITVENEPSNMARLAQERVMKISHINTSGEPLDLQVKVYLGFTNETYQLIHEVSLKDSATFDPDNPDEDNYVEIPSSSGIHVAITSADGHDFSTDDPDLVRKIAAGLQIGLSIFGILTDGEKPFAIRDRSPEDVLTLNQPENEPVWYSQLDDEG